MWELSSRGAPDARPMADRHYNRQKPGTPQFVPPGRCIVLTGSAEPALWVSSWPKYARHAFPGAWVNTLFRRDGAHRRHAASALIRAAVAHTRAAWAVPDLGMITFVDPEQVPGVMVRGERICGFSYLRAGFRHAGFSSTGLWAWQMLPADMPPPVPAIHRQGVLWPSNC